MTSEAPGKDSKSLEERVDDLEKRIDAVSKASRFWWMLIGVVIGLGMFFVGALLQHWRAN